LSAVKRMLLRSKVSQDGNDAPEAVVAWTGAAPRVVPAGPKSAMGIAIPNPSPAATVTPSRVRLVLAATVARMTAPPVVVPTSTAREKPLTNTSWETLDTGPGTGAADAGMLERPEVRKLLVPGGAAVCETDPLAEDPAGPPAIPPAAPAEELRAFGPAVVACCPATRFAVTGPAVAVWRATGAVAAAPPVLDLHRVL
jgi:hypothetical protein